MMCECAAIKNLVCVFVLVLYLYICNLLLLYIEQSIVGDFTIFTITKMHDYVLLKSSWYGHHALERTGLLLCTARKAMP